MGWPAGLTKRTCLESLESLYFTADIFLNPPNHYYRTDGPRSEVLITRKDSFKETFTVDSDQGELADLASFAAAVASLEHEGATLPAWGHRVDSPNKHFSATVYSNETATNAVLEFHEQTPGEARDEALHVFLFEAEDFRDLAARAAKRHAELRDELRADRAKRAGPEEQQKQAQSGETRRDHLQKEEQPALFTSRIHQDSPSGAATVAPPTLMSASADNHSNPKRRTTMSDEQSNTTTAAQEQNGQESARTPPLYELRLAGVQARIDKNATERGTFYSAAVFRTFTGRDGSEKVTYSIREQDIPAATQLLQEAQRRIQAEREQTQGQEQQVQVTRNR
jgi:hypothetical protein